MNIEVDVVFEGQTRYTFLKGTRIPHSINDEASEFRPGLAIWHSFGKIHREGAAAQIRIPRGYGPDSKRGDASEEIWCKDGQFHREGGPAVTMWVDGVKSSESWFENGLEHRNNEPSTIWYDSDGAIRCKEWRNAAKLHRKDGPAFEQEGQNEWLVNGEHHRLDGPAIEGPSPRYFIYGYEYSKELWEKLVPIAKGKWIGQCFPEELLNALDFDDHSGRYVVAGHNFQIKTWSPLGIYLDDNAREVFWGTSPAYADVIVDGDCKVYQTQSEFDADFDFSGPCKYKGRVVDDAKIVRLGQCARYRDGVLSGAERGQSPARVDIRGDAIVEFVYKGVRKPPLDSPEYCTFNLTKGLAQTPDGTTIAEFEPCKRALEKLESFKTKPVPALSFPHSDAIHGACSISCGGSNLTLSDASVDVGEFTGTTSTITDNQSLDLGATCQAINLTNLTVVEDSNLISYGNSNDVLVCSGTGITWMPHPANQVESKTTDPSSLAAEASEEPKETASFFPYLAAGLLGAAVFGVAQAGSQAKVKQQAEAVA